MSIFETLSNPEQASFKYDEVLFKDELFYEGKQFNFVILCRNNHIT
jgi:hypothetical protein